MSNIPGSSQSHVVIIHTKKGVERYQIKGKLNRGKSKYALKKGSISNVDFFLEQTRNGAAK
jgi:hypothetical protein